jgi:hypothetical protein
LWGWIGSGFGSKLGFGSGFINMRIKLPGKDSAGVVTAFYVSTYTQYKILSIFLSYTLHYSNDDHIKDV